ncbi:MAG: hypothetical protein AB3N13_14400 [Arenibacterium sp.]
MQRHDLMDGVWNLLGVCGGLRSGQSLVILHEADDAGYYAPGMAGTVAVYARELGIATKLIEVPFAPLGGELCDTLRAAMANSDATLFLARLGDQLRFCADMGQVNVIMCYALDCEALASCFGRVPHNAMLSLKDAANTALISAREIRVTCPLGTDLRGSFGIAPEAVPDDVHVRRFPMLVFAPVPADNFSGVIVQSGFVVGTGTHFYEPYAIPLENPVQVSVEAGRMVGFDGLPQDVARLRGHYHRIGDQFGVDPFQVHSWHAGIHPGCAFDGPASSDFHRWSGSAFGNPRLMHFHTCGDSAPGEISLNLLDPTIALDGVDVWSEGCLDPSKLPGGAEILHATPHLARLFQDPKRQVGEHMGALLAV